MGCYRYLSGTASTFTPDIEMPLSHRHPSLHLDVHEKGIRCSLDAIARRLTNWYLSISSPAHRWVINTVNVAIRCGSVEAISHSLHIVIPIQVLEGVLHIKAQPLLTQAAAVATCQQATEDGMSWHERQPM